MEKEQQAMPIPRAYPRQRFHLTWKQTADMARLLLSGRACEGDARKRFEEAFASFLDVPHAVAFGSSRAGMYHVLKQLDLSPGDEVICPAYTFFVVPAVVVLAGLKPVFVDVDPHTFNMDPALVEAAVTPRSRVLVITHIHGVAAPGQALRAVAQKHGIRILEDCAHACGLRQGERYAGTEDIGCFSLGIGKNLPAIQGGIVATTDSTLAHRLQQAQEAFASPTFGEVLRTAATGVAASILTSPGVFGLTLYPVLRLQAALNRDWVDRLMDDPVEIPEQVHDSFHVHLSNLQAALSLERLRELPHMNRRLRENAAAYHARMAPAASPSLYAQQALPGDEPLHMHYTVRAEDPQALRKALLRRGLDTQMDYCRDCAALPGFSTRSVSCPVSSSLTDRAVFLPNYPDLPPAAIRHAMKGLDRRG